MINEVAYSPNIVWVSYGADRYDPAKFKPINYTDMNAVINNKPYGGVWACPENSEYGWYDWCNSEGFLTDKLEKSFRFKLAPGAKIYVIDNEDDLVKISTSLRYAKLVGRKYYSIDFERLLKEGYDGIYVTDNAIWLRDYYGPEHNVVGLYSWDVESICVFNPDVIVPIEDDEPMKLGMGDLKEMIEKCSSILCESMGQFNIRNVYHVSDTVFDEFKTDVHFPYIFFSSKPIYLSGANNVYVCNLSMHNPFVFKHAISSWSYPLWLYLTDREGNLIPEEEFTREKYDGYLGCPYEFWSIVYYDDDEYEMDQIPEVVAQLNMGYDGVIIPNIDEGDNPIEVDDYIVFSPEQVQIVNRYTR